MADLFGQVVFAVLFALAMGAFARFSRREPTVDGGGAELRHGPAIAVGGWVGVAGALLFLSFPLFDSSILESTLGLSMWLGMALFFGGLGVWCLAAARREVVRLLPDGIEARASLEREPTSLRWNEIQAVRFSRLTGYLTLVGRDRRVRVSAMLTGSGELADLVARRVPTAEAQAAVHGFLAYRAGYGMGRSDH